jgi:hypothetical protein
VKEWNYRIESRDKEQEKKTRNEFATLFEVDDADKVSKDPHNQHLHFPRT